MLVNSFRGRFSAIARRNDHGVLTPGQWQIAASHPEYKQYSVFIMFRHLALHDLYHAYRIEERLLER